MTANLERKTLEQLINSKDFDFFYDGDDICVRILDVRGYAFVVFLNRKPFDKKHLIVAGCHEWYSFEQALGYYTSEKYTSDGDKEECSSILRLLRRYYDKYHWSAVEMCKPKEEWVRLWLFRNERCGIRTGYNPVFFSSLEEAKKSITSTPEGDKVVGYYEIVSKRVVGMSE